MHSKEGKHQVQLNAGSHGGHLHAEGRARGGTRRPRPVPIVVGFNEVGFAKHVDHLRCVHRSHFQSGFLN